MAKYNTEIKIYVLRWNRLWSYK